MNAERGGLELSAQSPLYPVTNADFATPPYLQFAEGYYLTRDGMKWFWDACTTDPAQRAEKYASPLQATLTGRALLTDHAEVTEERTTVFTHFDEGTELYRTFRIRDIHDALADLERRRLALTAELAQLEPEGPASGSYRRTRPGTDGARAAR